MGGEEQFGVPAPKTVQRCNFAALSFFPLKSQLIISKLFCFKMSSSAKTVAKSENKVVCKRRKTISQEECNAMLKPLLKPLRELRRQAEVERDEAAAAADAAHQLYEENQKKFQELLQGMGELGEEDFDAEGLDTLKTRFPQMLEVYEKGIELENQLQAAKEKEDATKRNYEMADRSVSIERNKHSQNYIIKK
jgi:hypothetical protein